MEALRKLETLLARWLEDGLAARLGARLQPVEIAHRLVDFMVDHRTVAAGHRYVPNVYRVYLSPRTLQPFAGYRERLQEELAAYLQDRAREMDDRMVGRAHVELVADASVKPGRLRIEADLLATAASAEPTPGQYTQPISMDTAQPRPAPVLVLILDQRHIVIDGRRPVSIGRALDNDIVIDHPSVSRHHARLLHQGSGWLLEDLGSTNGSFVNNGRVSAKFLRRGDSVRFGSVTVLIDQPEDEAS